MDQHLQLRGETLQLPSPIAEYRYGAQHQRGARHRVSQQGGNELRGLAQAHVVGQTCPQPQSPQERHPTHTSFLICAQSTLKMRRCGDGGDGGMDGVVE